MTKFSIQRVSIYIDMNYAESPAEILVNNIFVVQVLDVFELET